MAENNTAMIKELAKLRQENEKLEKLINFVRMENFEHTLHCNRMETVLQDINAVTKKNPVKLMEALGDMSNIIHTTEIPKRKHVKANETVRTAHSSLQITEKSPPYTKAHVVKPHMVNGHILYAPTINLTRVPDLKGQTRKIDKKAETPGSNANCSSAASTSDHLDENDTENNNAPDLSGTYEEQNGLSLIQEVSEPESLPSSSSSSSPASASSPLLSGTFQQVKIYLNQASTDSLLDESQGAKRKTKSQGRTNLKKKRSTSSVDNVTKRKRS